MANLILRPSGLEEKHNKPWALQLRFNGPVETEYYTIAYVTDQVADDIVEAGACYYLFGPMHEEREKARALERARALREEADNIEASMVKK